jgi:hypothetical protein
MYILHTQAQSIGETRRNEATLQRVTVHAVLDYSARCVQDAFADQSVPTIHTGRTTTTFPCRFGIQLRQARPGPSRDSTTPHHGRLIRVSKSDEHGDSHCARHLASSLRLGSLQIRDNHVPPPR